MLFYQAIFFLFLNISCNEDFNPYGEFKKEYALVCILRDDTTHQVGVISCSYAPNQQGETNVFLEGADMRVWVGDSVYIFKDTTINYSNNNTINPQTYYYNNNFQILPSRNLEVEVLLQNGKRLKSISKSPDAVRFLRESNITVPTINSNLVKVYWDNTGTGFYYLPKLEIKYLYNGEVYFREVPLRYENNMPIFPLSNNRKSVIYNLDAISKTLEQISENNPEKNSYSIYQSLIFSVIVFDKEVSKYLSSTAQSKIDITITLNFPDYSNINGGLGIFGSQLKGNYNTLFFVEEYITEFGYKIILN